MKVKEKLAGYKVITNLENNKKNVGWVNPQDVTHQTETVGYAALTPPAITSRETLPIGWLWSTLGEVAHVLAGNPAPQGDEFFAEGKYPFVRVQDMGRLNGAIRIHSTNDCVNEKAVKGLRLFPRGSVLFTKSGASTLLNQRAILGSDMYVVSHIAIAIPKDEILSEWLYFWLRTVDFAHLAHATTLPSLPLSRAKGILIPLAPLDQQKRIVEEIEKQFSRLDEAVANLKRVKANLKRYKAAVLKAAVEGRLVETEAELARREGRSYETGEQLLQRILETRRNQWQGKGKYKEPAAPDTTKLPELPEGWVWCGFEQISLSDKHALKAGPFGSALKKETYVESGYKIYGQEQVISGDPTFGDYFVDEAKYRELVSCAVKPGDLLISLVGTAGKVLVLPPTALPGIINPRLLKLSLNPAFIVTAYAAYMLQSAWAKHYFKLQAHGGTMEILNLGIIRALPVPLPPLHEQHRIVAEVERYLSLANQTEAQVNANLQRAERLKQSILARAFTGNLISEVI